MVDLFAEPNIGVAFMRIRQTFDSCRQKWSSLGKAQGLKES